MAYKARETDQMLNKLQYLIDMMEFQILAEMANSHLSVANRLQRAAQEMIGSTNREGISPEEKKQLEEQARENLMQAATFKSIYTEEIKACDMANRKIMKIMESHYQPIKTLARKAVAKPVAKPAQEKPSPPPVGAKCDKCKEPAVLSKDGKNCCRIHYGEVFPPEDKKDDVPSPPMAPPSTPPPAPPMPPAV